MGQILDPRAAVYRDKRIAFQGSSWYEPSGAAIMYDDFIGGVIDLNNWDAVSVQATGGTDWAYSAGAGGAAATAGHGGWAAGITGTGDDDMEALFGPLSWKSGRAGNGFLVFETAVNLPVITTVACIAGFTDAITETGAGNLWNLATTTMGTQVPSDGCVWMYDTDATTDVFYGVGTANDVDTTFAAAAVGVVPTADIPFRLRIEIDSAQVGHFFMAAPGAGNSQDVPLESYGAVAACGRSTVAMCPVLGVTARADTDSLAMEADYVFVACKR